MSMSLSQEDQKDPFRSNHRHLEQCRKLKEHHVDCTKCQILALSLRNTPNQDHRDNPTNPAIESLAMSPKTAHPKKRLVLGTTHTLAPSTNQPPSILNFQLCLQKR